MKNKTRSNLRAYRETEKKPTAFSGAPTLFMGGVQVMSSTCYFCETVYVKAETKGYCPKCGAVRTH